MRLIRRVCDRVQIGIGCAITCLRFSASTILITTYITSTTAAFADDLNRVVPFNIKAQTLEKALLQFGAQAHVQMSVAMNSAIRQLQVPNIRGNYTGRQALQILLRGTKLTFDIRGDMVEVSSRAVEVPQPGDPAQSGNADSKEKNKTKPKRQVLQEVVVTGSRLLATSKFGPQEVQIYDHDTIEQSGQLSVADFLSTLPSVSVTSPQIVTNFSTSVRLRGLPLGTTLVLLNGRRLEGSGTSNGDYFDLSSIPMEAVDSIEVDQNGSSAIYGSDAIAGVVNIILKKDFDGFAADVRYGWAKDAPTRTVGLALGKQWSQGGFSVIGSFENDGGLSSSERLLSASNDYAAYGGPNDNYPACSPGNVFSVNGAALPGAPPGSNSMYAAITGSAASGKPSLSQFTYGELNQCSVYYGQALLPSTKRAGVLAQGNLTITSAITLFAELMYTHVTKFSPLGYNPLFGTSTFQEYTVSASNPYNPFGTTVGVTEQLRDVPETEDMDSDFFRPLIGLKGQIGNRWQWELSAWQSTDWTSGDYENAYPDATAIQAALDSANSATALNPFVNGPAGSQSVLQSLFGDELYKNKGQDRSAEAFIRGSPLQLPAGQVNVVVGADYDRSELYLNVNAPGTTTIDTYQRNYYALFGEVSIPILPHLKGFGSASSPLLTATIAGRNDHYNDFGGANTEQFGLELRPADGFLVRGTYATTFAAPSLIFLYNPDRTVDSFISDPVTGQTYVVPSTLGGNSRLLPEQGHSSSLGVVYSSYMIPGLQLSASQWDVIENDLTQSFGPQLIVEYESDFPGRVTRNAAGQITEINATVANFGSIDVAGLDYQLDYSHRVGGGTGSIDLDATQTYHYLQALTLGSRPIESVGIAETDSNWAPRWKGTVGMGWLTEFLNVHVDGRYTSAYQDYDSSRIIGNFWLFDASIRWSVGKWLGQRDPSLRGGFVEVGGTNIFNRATQFSNYDFDEYGYDAAQISPLGRSLYVEGGTKW
jgi:iron complex outermembrane recepter protein